MELTRKKKVADPDSDNGEKRMGKFARKIALLSAISVLSACGGESMAPSAMPTIIPPHEEGIPQIAYSKPKPAIVDKSATIELASGVNPGAQPLCSSRNEIPLKDYDYELKSGMKYTYLAADMAQGTCARFSAQHEYTLYLKGIIASPSGNNEYDFIIHDEKGSDLSSVISPGKYLRLGQDASVSLVTDFVHQGRVMVFFHKSIDSKRIAIQLNDCEKAGDKESCEVFADNLRAYLLALEKVTGINLGSCYSRIIFAYDSGYQGAAHAFNNGEVGYIVAGPSFLIPRLYWWLTPVYKYDEHEPIHLARFCGNTYINDEGNHIFWEPTSDAATSEYGDQITSKGFWNSLVFWLDEVGSDLGQILNANAPAIDRCSGLKSFFLGKEYASQTEQGKIDLVMKFHEKMSNDPRMLRESSEKEAMTEIVCGLASDPDCLPMLKKNCP
jgi:hypothetical protein